MTSTNIEGVTVCWMGVRRTRMRLTVLQVEDREREREYVCVCKRERERESGGNQGYKDEAYCAPGRGQRERA